MQVRTNRKHSGPMSSADHGRSPSSASAAATDTTDRAARRPWWLVAGRASLLALASFAAITLMLLYLVSRFQHEHNDVGTNVNFFLGADLATPLIGCVWLLIVANGLILCLGRQTRTTGIGLVVAAAVIAVPVVIWVLWTLATFSSG